MIYGSAKVHRNSQVVFRLLDLFYLHRYTNIQACKEPLTTIEYTIKDSSTFAEELQSFDSKLAMASFDIESPFTNIPLQGTMDLCVEKFI